MSEPGSYNPREEAMLDLLIKQVTEGLSPEEQHALDGMDSTAASTYLRDFERAAAAISLASTLPAELSPTLRARIEQDAQAFVVDSKVTALGPVRDAMPVNPRSGSYVSAAGWYAAAACLVLAVFGWLRSPQLLTPSPTANVPRTVAPIRVPRLVTPSAPTPAEERAALLAQAGSLKVILNATHDPVAGGVTADAVWDPATQRGFLRLVGLKPNDPLVQQYQAWIFDAERDKRYPLDAGVFDVTPDSSEVIVPIRAQLPVRVAKAFAVTVEKAGGVVVSALHHVVVLGTAG
jgi:Anti-sigma-K factor rskA